MTTTTARGSKRFIRVLALLLGVSLTVIPCSHVARAQLPGLPPLPTPTPTPTLPPLPPVLPPIPPLDLSLAPPALPTIPSLPQILPVNPPPPSSSVELPVTGARLDAKILVISADGTEPVLQAIRQAADYRGIPYTLYVATSTPGGFTPGLLSDGSTHAFYQGIVLTTGTLAVFDGANWVSAFSTSEWQTLWDYQAKYRVRTVIAYAFPTADLGYGPATGVDTGTSPIGARLTATGRPVFPYMNAAEPLTITRAWTYLAPASGSGTNVLLTDAQNHALTLVRTYPDGRQVLSMTFDNNFFLVHSLAVMHGVLNWVAGGVFLGERHVYMGPQVDDIFLDNDMYGGGTYRLGGVDWTAVAAWQTQKRLQPVSADLALHMAFNGEGTAGKYAFDTLTPAALLTQGQFPWINHTYTHENLDAVTYTVAYQEITRNNQTAASMGLTNYDPRALVTPDVSGLANPEAMRAAYNAGVRFIVTDTSRPGMDNPTPQAGIRNAHQPGILMVPRRPTNLYYNVSTPSEWTAEYNYIYRSFWGRDLSYQEILDKESDVLLQYMLRGEADPWMFHQANLRAYDGVRSLLGDLLDRALQKYARIMVVPVRSPTHAAVGEGMLDRMQYNAAGVRASIAPSQGTITITASATAVVPVTGLCSESAEAYGGQCISYVSLDPGESVTYRLDGSGQTSNPAPGVLAVNPGPRTAVVVSASPNPFRPETAISFTTTRAGHVTATIYDVTGQRVRTLLDGTLEGGSHTLRWNGSTESGRPAASGAYFLKLHTPDGDGAKRLVLTK